MGNKKADILTVRFIIIDKTQTEPLWESFKKDSLPFHGMLPRAMSWGDMFAERDALESRYEIAKSLLEREGCWEALEKLDRLEKLFSMNKIRGL